MYRLEYNPTPETCLQFFLQALNMITDSTCAVTDLESDLMKSLMGTTKPNFPIDLKFPWMIEAKEKITQMFEENILQPMDLLNQYKKYEYLLNVDYKQLIEQLFDNKELEAETGSGKAEIKVIREAITLYHNASEEISNLSNDWIDTPMFRVQAAKIKVQLSNAALKIRDALIKAV